MPKNISKECSSDKLEVERVDHPNWYNQGSIEVIDFIEDQKMSFTEGSVIKYTCRYKYKGKRMEDLFKAKFHLDRLIKQERDLLLSKGDN